VIRIGKQVVWGGGGVAPFFSGVFLGWGGGGGGGGCKLWFRKDCWTLLRQIIPPPHPLPPVAVARYDSLAGCRLVEFYL